MEKELEKEKAFNNNNGGESFGFGCLLGMACPMQENDPEIIDQSILLIIQKIHRRLDQYI